LHIEKLRIKKAAISTKRTKISVKLLHYEINEMRPWKTAKLIHYEPSLSAAV